MRQPPRVGLPRLLGVYKRDARQLVRSGLTGGKGIPESVAEHPCVFATFTAPSFGPVHARRERGKRAALPPPPRRLQAVLPARPRHLLPARHAEDDPRLGRPMCPDCYDYESAVVFNLPPPTCGAGSPPTCPATSPVAGVTGKELRAELSIRFVKVAEYQARGVVHFHAIFRLDANTEDASCRRPPGRPPRALRRHHPGRWPSASSPHRARAALRLRFGARPNPPVWRVPLAAPASRCSWRGGELYRQVRHQVRRTARPSRYRVRPPAEIEALRCSAHYRR